MSPLIELIGGAKSYGWGNLAAGGSFESIATVTAAGGEASLTFSSIPATYASLQIRGIFRDEYTDNPYSSELQVRFNSDTGANYVSHWLQGDGSTVSAPNNTGANFIKIISAGVADAVGANIYGASIIDIHDYASTTKNKVTRARAGANTNTTSTEFKSTLNSGLWLNTSAITSIGLLAPNNFKAGSTFALYGIKGA
jgi:hypothetical protein